MTDNRPPYEPGASYRTIIDWIVAKAASISKISPVISGAYLALAGDLEDVRKSAMDSHHATTKQPTPPHDTESL